MLIEIRTFPFLAGQSVRSDLILFVVLASHLHRLLIHSHIRAQLTPP